ncbi:hypothetical protein SCLCIDRAFT_102679 [Scleroderma citrinum Foug A]|uniref:Fungal lipase-type domain-containing protein n=1 Tax=Scleroderma citrinum Foug A TaxID=1036808 RepID=A0A0C3EA79_9AGAM|nr:hypothetical protein SCLCIDRAFT_102679 [Scleroderma citrinum Foug A]
MVHSVLEVSTTMESSETSLWPRFPQTGDPSTGIDQETYDNLVRYTKYASASYQTLCPRPMGNTLVGEASTLISWQFTNLITAMHGFVAKDDKRNEFVVSFRGTKETSTILIDASVVLTPLRGVGLPTRTSQESAAQPRVHAGFLLAYESIARTLLDILDKQIESHPTYSVIATGHSLGGAIASIASIAIRNLYPRTNISLYTTGKCQPRTGNPAYAALVESMIGVDNIYRGVHLIDGVPTMIPKRLGYQHHATEYWQFTELPAPEHVRRCQGYEDPEGSASIPSSGVNPAHWIYFGQPIASDPSVCFVDWE